MKKILTNCRGQAMVELALILPVLLLLVFGIVEFGRIFSTQLLVTASAREAVREAVVGAGDEGIVLCAKNSASILDGTKMEIDISPEEDSRTRGNPVTVRIDYPVKIYAPIISGIIGDPFVVSGEVTMRVE
ncbi:MAG: TadE/TadG family type IV pilus assembly protein [Bacillota bacterium]